MVSVIVPVYNSETYLEETIVSIINQSYLYFEIILIDDGSVDSSGSICDEFAQKDNRIRVVHIQNSGPSTARNIGIQISKGEYILPVDSDDIIEPTYIEKAVRVLEDNDDIGIVYCQARLIGDCSGEWRIPIYSLPEILIRNCIFATAMFRKTDFDLVGGYSKEMESGLEDYDLWLSIIALNRKVYQIPEVLFLYRKHNGSRTEKFESDIKQVRNMKSILYKRHRELYEKMYFIPPEDEKIALYGMGGAGKTYYHFLQSIGNNAISCIVDQNNRVVFQINSKNCVCSPQELLHNKYDKIIVAINNEDTVAEIRDWLLDNHYLTEQVIWYINESQLR